MEAFGYKRCFIWFFSWATVKTLLAMQEENTGIATDPHYVKKKKDEYFYNNLLKFLYFKISQRIEVIDQSFEKNIGTYGTCLSRGPDLS